MISESYCGYIAIVGRPNVGKSTLLNTIIGEKISITSRKPQTTRHRILGIHTENHTQMIFVDTPGIHLENKKAMNRYMNRTALAALMDVDVIIFMCDATRWTKEDDWVLENIKKVSRPVILVINKVDKIKDKDALLPLLQTLYEKMTFKEVIPLSAKTGMNVEGLLNSLMALIPQNPYLFPEDQITDRTERFMTAELIREKLFLHVGDELPYALTVEIEEFKELENLIRIRAVIWIEKQSQKSIVIGKDGNVLKKVGQTVRLELEKRWGNKVFLQLWVKVKKGWSDNERALQSLGYE